MDGEEDTKEGLDLYEFAEILMELGAWNAAVSVKCYKRAVQRALSLDMLHMHDTLYSAVYM